MVYVYDGILFSDKKNLAIWDTLVVLRGGLGLGREGEQNESRGSKVQTSSYKVSQSRECEAQQGDRT